MDNLIKKDILRILAKVNDALKKNDVKKISETSDEINHNSSIFQDEDSITLAVVVYATSKIKYDSKIKDLFKKAKLALSRSDYENYREFIKKITGHIHEIDSKMNNYVLHVYNAAEVKKGSKLFSNGISLPRVAELLNISQWELMSYMGKTNISDTFEKDKKLRKRLNHVRSFIGVGKIIVFDTGPIISLTLNNLLWLIEALHREFRGSFYIPIAVKKELIDRPLQTKKFKFEALQIIQYIGNGTLEVIENDFILSKTRYLMDLANRCFKAKGKWIQMIQEGEMEALATALYFKTDTVVVDERITRMLIENPPDVKYTLQRRLHTGVQMNTENVKKLHDEIKHFKVIRSVELVTIAYELGLLNKYMGREQQMAVKDIRKALLEGVLWAVKLNGCSVSRDEIEDIIKIEKDV